MRPGNTDEDRLEDMKNQTHHDCAESASATAPVVVQQLGDILIVEHAVILLVQRKVFHHALQEGHSCRQHRIMLVF